MEFIYHWYTLQHNTEK